MSLWSSDSMETILKNLVNGLNRQWTKLGHDSRIPSLGQHREGGSILLGSIGSTTGIELLSPIPALAPFGGAGSDRLLLTPP